MNVAFVPVRGGSKSIPLKNIKNFCGRPLLYWNLLALEESNSVDKVYVATDSEQIKNVARSMGFSKVVIYDRDEENAADTSSTESAVLEFLEGFNCNPDDLLILSQVTSPFTQAGDYDGAVRLLKNGDYDSVLTCARIKRFFWSGDGKPINYDYTDRPRRQDFDGILIENGAVYINSVANILKYRNRLCGKIGIYEMDEYTAIEIDEEDDWFLAERLMKNHVLRRPAICEIKLFLSDVDGTLTDAGMYYGENGEEFKKFNTHDGKAFELLRKSGIKSGIITSENTEIVKNRATKIGVDYLRQGVSGGGKLAVAQEICASEGIDISQVAYIGDDINCKALLESVGVAACPENALREIKNIPGIVHLENVGGNGAVREFVDYLLTCIKERRES